MQCPACGSANDDGRKFCGECGAALARPCPACGVGNAPGVKFCGECGSPLDAVAAAPAAVAERRLVSVLFADLVGFTALSESRDAEDVRELLSRYFDTCRTLIARYGGTVEKFIGDAVMAVWGAPVAMEDDAECAVRAALDLSSAVQALAQEVGAGDLRVRAGVLTGEAAVTIGARGEGMVAGDIVNTASRIQSVAEPGTVLVGETTRRATEAAVVYEDAGARELKGKSEPVPVWRAVRVIGGRGGAQRSTGLESPFVGRDRELRVIKELYHASAAESKAHLVSVIAVAGTGKSRLSWELFKYVDGLADSVRWHRGRCLPYGEGVTYWALAEMVRTRAEIIEGEEPEVQLAKLHDAVEEAIADPDERRFVEPRLAHLLGLDEGAPGDRENLFSAWRLFYERLAEEMPTVMVFEDMEWADAALLDFIEHLVEWSKSHPLFVVVLARPELVERRPTWGSGMRAFTSLYLEPLVDDDMERLLSGLAPGLPDELRARIRERAEGVPLYAMEIVRMLLDRGVLVREGSMYVPAGSVDTIEVPETLHALIAARLDGLTPDERRVVQDAAVLGKTFVVGALASLSGVAAADLEPVLAALVRKEVLTIQADRLSPERGQYGFLQDMMRRVAYEMLSKRDRKAKHLAAAALDADEDEVVEVVAAHLLAAYRADPDADDGGVIRQSAAAALVRAGERAASLAASLEAQRYFEQAAELADDAVDQARLIERAGVMARGGARSEAAIAHFERAMALFEEAGERHQAARVSARLGEAMWDRGKLVEPLEQMDAALELLSSEEPDADLAALAAQVGRFRFFSGDLQRAMDRVETALRLAEELNLPDVLSHALNTKGIILANSGRFTEGGALIAFALDIALENDVPTEALRGYNNVADIQARLDRYERSAAVYGDGLTLARRVGNRSSEWQFLAQVYPLYALGRWDEALDAASQVPDESFGQIRFPFVCLVGPVCAILAARGELAEADRIARLHPELRDSDDLTELAAYAWAEAVVALARGDVESAMRSADLGWRTRDVGGISSEGVKESFAVGGEAALRAGRRETAERFLAELDGIPGSRGSQALKAHTGRFRAMLAAGDDTERADRLFRNAAALFRELAMPFPMAQTLVEHVETLRPDTAAALLDEAHATFDGLGARVWAERVERAAEGEAAAPRAS
jgi:class 3 adenylate cyclase/tetratricopeptide (TPR) repeat protein